VPRLRDQRSRHLQAHRIHARPDQPPGRRQEHALERGFQGSFSELFLDYTGQRRVRLRLGSDFPAELQPTANRCSTPAAAGNCPAALCRLPAFIDRVRAAGHDLRCQDDALAFVAEVRDGEARRRRTRPAYPLGADSPELKTLLKVELYPYQREGALVRRARRARPDRRRNGPRQDGAGDRGDGNLRPPLCRRTRTDRLPDLAQASVGTRDHPFQRAPGDGHRRSARVRQARYAQDDFCKITNYETLSRDLDLIEAWAPDVVIVDEAQRIKNWNTIAARALKRIDSPYALVLTGTPLENRLEELISIVQFVDQHRLGPTWRLLDEHQQRDERGRVIGYRELHRIGQTLAPIMLRRRKAEVLEQLPERVDNTLFMPMSPLQADHHEENRQIVARIVQRWRHTGFLSEKDQLRMHCSLQNMRMSCNSSFPDRPRNRRRLQGRRTGRPARRHLRRPAGQGRRLQPVAAHARADHPPPQRAQRGWEHVLFHGGVPGDKRGALIDRFNNDPACRVFLSTDAGGVGLNLQHAAAVVVNMDLPWNPAVLEQRIGRVHRLGQTRGVQVINFVARGTIEEGMLSVLAFKQSLFAGVLDGGESEVVLQGTRLSKFMETVEQVSGAVGSAEHRSTSRATTLPLDATPAAGAETKPTARPNTGSRRPPAKRQPARCRTRAPPAEPPTPAPRPHQGPPIPGRRCWPPACSCSAN
jgi:hypothetical protein